MSNKDMYSSIDKKEVSNILKKADWILLTEQPNGLNYRTQRFGYSDYQDHRNDTLKAIKSKILDNIIKSNYQRLNFYQNKDIEKPITKVYCWGYLGGISATVNSKIY